MSIYSVKGKGWRYDFILEGTRYTKGWFKRKQDAQKAATLERKEEIKNPAPPREVPETPTDMAFLDLVNLPTGLTSKRITPIEHYTDHVFIPGAQTVGKGVG